jgi:hypothetical protein
MVIRFTVHKRAQIVPQLAGTKGTGIARHIPICAAWSRERRVPTDLFESDRTSGQFPSTASGSPLRVTDGSVGFVTRCPGSL